MPTLVLDTSGAFSTVIAARGLELLGVSSLRTRSSAHLHDQIRTLAKRLAIGLDDFRSLGVVVGPGSWTGLNIGVTAAKVLAQVLERPLIPISSLDALVAPYDCKKGRICGLLGAGRQQVYYAWYEAPGGTSRRGTPGVAPFDSWLEHLAKEEGAPLIVEYGRTHYNALLELRPTIHAKHHDRLRPEALVKMAACTRALDGEAILGLVPTYLQPSLFERDAAKRPHAHSRH